MWPKSSEKAHLWPRSCQSWDITLPSADSVQQPIVNIRCYLIIATKYIQNLRTGPISFPARKYEFKGSEIQFLWQRRLLVVRQIGGADGDLGGWRITRQVIRLGGRISRKQCQMWNALLEYVTRIHLPGSLLYMSFYRRVYQLWHITCMFLFHSRSKHLKGSWN